MKFKLKLNHQRGYTLAEVMVVLVIMGIIAAAMGIVLPQMTSIPQKGENQVDALSSLENAIHWVSRDAGSAAAAVGGGSLTLTMPDSSEVSYTTADGVLYRNCGGTSQTVARNITDLSFTISDRLITMSVTAQPESRWNISESRTYQVAMRPSGI
jgi:prepilin-type N-terminal cleavage/methylation domain-containing protein